MHAKHDNDVVPFAFDIAVPRNLVSQSKGTWAAFSIVPWFSREQRRMLARDLRKGTNAPAQRLSDDALLMRALLDSRGRFRAFWQFLEKIETRGLKEALRRPTLSIDYYLLDRIRPDFIQYDYDRSTVEAAMPSLSEAEDRLKTALEKRHMRSGSDRFGPLMVWIDVAVRLDRWDHLAETDRQDVANSVFALDAITDGNLFRLEATRRIPMLADYFLFPSQGTGPAKLEADEKGPVSWDAEWGRLWSEMGELAAKAVTADKKPEMLDDLISLAGALEALRSRIPEKLDFVAHFEQKLSELKAVLDELAVSPGCDWLTTDCLAAVLKRWDPSSVLGHQAEALIGEAERAIVDVRADFKRHDTTVAERQALEIEIVEVSHEYAAMRNPSKRLDLLERRGRLQTRQGEVEKALVELQQSIVDKASPYREPFQWELQNAAVVIDGIPMLTEPSGDCDVTAAPRECIVEPEALEARDAGEVVFAEQDAGDRPALSELCESEDERLVPFTDEQPVVRLPESGSLRGDCASASPSETEAMALPSESGVDTDELSAQAGERCRPAWKAIGLGRLDLAWNYVDALHRVDAALVVPSPTLLKACALANHCQSGDGEISRILASLYAELDRGLFESGPPSWTTSLGLLLVAGTLRPSLVAPTSGATAVLRYAHVSPALYKFASVVIEAGERLQGLNLSPVAFRGMHSLATWDEQSKILKDEVVQWRQASQRMTMKCVSATQVWLRLQSTDRDIGLLLGPILRDDADATASVRKQVGVLGDHGSFTELVRRIDRKEIKRRIGEEIQAAPLNQLRERTGEAVDFARRWLALMETRPKGDDYAAKQLDDLRSKLGSLRSEVDAELSHTAAEAVGAWSLPSAAVAVVRASLNGLDALFTPGIPVPEPEPDAARLLGQGLLLAPSLDLADDWRPEQQPLAVLEAVAKLIDSASDDWERAFASRLERGDLDGAAKTQRYLHEMGHGLADTLDQCLSGEGEQRRLAMRGRLNGARNELETALAYGYLNEQERARLDARLVGVERRLDTMGRLWEAADEIERVAAEIATHRDSGIAELRRQFGELQLATESDAHRRLAEVIADGDVLVANEYLQRVKGGERLPAREEAARDVFSEFFPAGVTQIAAFVQTENRSFNDIVRFIRTGDAMAGIDLSALSESQRRSATEMLQAWFALKRIEKPNTDSLRTIFSTLGFSVIRVKIVSEARGRAELDLETEILADRATCPVPAFGSQAVGRYRIVCVWGRPTEDDVPRIIGDIPARPTIVLYLGGLRVEQRRELSRAARGEKRRAFLLLDEILMLFLCTEPKSRLSAFFACALPFTLVEPFVTTSGLIPPEMFYGRADELQAVREPNGRCFIYGGRQLGKTALLREAERSFHAPAEGRFAKWIDLKAEGLGYTREPGDIWTVLHRELKGMEGPFLALPEPVATKKGSVEDFVDALHRVFPPRVERRLLLLLDEADRFLEQDSRLEYQETARLKYLMEKSDRGFKVVFAGLHNVLRTTEQANHPLAHFGEPIEIGPLMRAGEWRQARMLVRAPLMAAGYAFTSEDLVVRVLAQTNYYPSLIQLYCGQLTRLLHDPQGRFVDYRGGPRYIITDRVVDEAYRSRELRDAIRSRFQLTLQLDPRYEVIAYLLAYGIIQGRISEADGSDAKAIRADCDAWWPVGFRGTADHEFRTILDEMVGLGVIRHVGDRGYSLRNPNVLRLMGTEEDVESVLLRARELPQEFEPSVFRAADPKGTPKRSPLNFVQERALLREENGVSVILGTAAAGLADIEYFLRARVGSEYLRVITDVSDLANFEKRLETLDSRAGGGTTVIAVPPQVPWTGQWVGTTAERLTRLRSKERHARVLFIGDPAISYQLLDEVTELQAKGVEVGSLRPWKDAFLRQWLEDIGITDADQAAREELRSLSGLWPHVLVRAALAAHGAHRIAALTQQLRENLVRADTREHRLLECGVSAGPARQFLSLLAELGEASIDDLGDFGPEYDLSPDEISRRIRWADLLGLIERTGASSWQIEPYVGSLLKP